MIVFSILKLVFLGVSTLLIAPLVAAVAAFDECRAYRLCQVWVRLQLLAFRVRVRTHRLAALDPGAAYVFMSNHRSQLDVLAVVTALAEFQLRWVAKKELTRVPVFGWALRRAGHIIIDRSNTAEAVASLRAARAQMLRGISVIIFPEGTRARSDDQLLLPFKKGGFMLALEAGFPIVPIAVRGSRPLLPRGAWRIAGGEIDVVVGPPMPIAGVGRDELMQRVRTFLLEQVRAGNEPARVPAAAMEAV